MIIIRMLEEKFEQSWLDGCGQSGNITLPVSVFIFNLITYPPDFMWDEESNYVGKSREKNKKKKNCVIAISIIQGH